MHQPYPGFGHTMPINVVCVEGMKLLSREELVQELIATSEEFILKPSLEDWGLGASDSRDDWELVIEEKVDIVVRHFAKYAILSHRWGPSELDYASTKRLKSLKNSTGLEKIQQFADQAKDYKCSYIWFDTGCINKTSSSEVEESIRSMYSWYQNAEVCIVYLGQTLDWSKSSDEDADVWFSRGWTLQELLAPRRMKFFNKHWEKMDDTLYDIDRTLSFKDASVNKAFLKYLSRVTGIYPLVRLHDFTPGIHQAREVLHWASHRHTSRPEDMSYCLIGLLGLHLAVAYGEGARSAFFRLQVEAIQRSEDRGLFFWSGMPSHGNSMLAATIEGFQEPTPWDSQGVRVHRFCTSSLNSDPTVALTNCGIRLVIPIYPLTLVSIEKRGGAMGQTLAMRLMVEGLRIEVKAHIISQDNRPLHTYRDAINKTWVLGVLGSAFITHKQEHLFLPLVLRRTRGDSTNRYQRCFTDRFSLNIGVDQDLKEPEVIFVR
ncbi:hypothetical protein ONZ45_g16289 [Pleurotus djamor]|nr:hypothetical protein ONZ45_g16289 [Pleurotus djamor]